MNELICFLSANGIDYICSASMKEYTTFKIGGCADVLIQPKNIDELKEIVSKVKEFNVPVTFIGNGSNLLVRDGGIRGAVIKFGKKFADYEVNGETIKVLSGISMAKIAAIATENSLTGFEFASGIPGTIGGGIVMNAGAYKGELGDVVTSVDALCCDGTIKTFSGAELDFSYRHSCFTGTDMLVVSATIKLQRGDREQIAARVNELSAKRRNSQPLEFPSAGSAFKRPANGYAAAMIDQSGLKGYAVGDAAVSEKHAGFVVNKGSASAADIEQLLKDVQAKVKETFDTVLEPEIIIIGEN